MTNRRKESDVLVWAFKAVTALSLAMLGWFLAMMWSDYRQHVKETEVWRQQAGERLVRLETTQELRAGRDFLR